MTDKNINDKKHPVNMTRKEIEVITSIIDCYINSCVANRYIIPDSNILLPLNLRLKYRITEIKEDEAFAKIMNMGIKND